MPSKIQLDENLLFLYRCLENSDYKTIDFHGVGNASNLKAPAARMRFTRLKKSIEAGTLTGGTTPQDSTPANGKSRIDRSRKRKTKDEDPTSRILLTDEIDEIPLKKEDGSNEVPSRRQTRGKKIDVRTAFESDTSPTPGARYEEDGSSDDYDGDSHITEDDEEFDVDEEDFLHYSKRRKSNSKGQVFAEKTKKQPIFPAKPIYHYEQPNAIITPVSTPSVRLQAAAQDPITPTKPKFRTVDYGPKIPVVFPTPQSMFTRSPGTDRNNSIASSTTNPRVTEADKTHTMDVNDSKYAQNNNLANSPTSQLVLSEASETSSVNMLKSKAMTTKKEDQQISSVAATSRSGSFDRVSADNTSTVFQSVERDAELMSTSDDESTSMKITTLNPGNNRSPQNTNFQSSFLQLTPQTALCSDQPTSPCTPTATVSNCTPQGSTFADTKVDLMTPAGPPDPLLTEHGFSTPDRAE